MGRLLGQSAPAQARDEVMAIKFEDDKGEAKSAKEVGGKTYVAEEPAPEPSAEADSALPFAKPVRPEKKGARIRNKPRA